MTHTSSQVNNNIIVRFLRYGRWLWKLTAASGSRFDFQQEVIAHNYEILLVSHESVVVMHMHGVVEIWTRLKINLFQLRQFVCVNHLRILISLYIYILLRSIYSLNVNKILANQFKLYLKQICNIEETFNFLLETSKVFCVIQSSFCFI